MSGEDRRGFCGRHEQNKAAYEIGGALALSEHFTAGEIAHISASSIGVLPALALARGETARFRELWLSLAAGDAGRFFLGFLKKPAVREQLYAFVAADLPFHCVFRSGQSVAVSAHPAL